MSLEVSILSFPIFSVFNCFILWPSPLLLVSNLQSFVFITSIVFFFRCWIRPSSPSGLRSVSLVSWGLSEHLLFVVLRVSSSHSPRLCPPNCPSEVCSITLWVEIVSSPTKERPLSLGLPETWTHMFRIKWRVTPLTYSGEIHETDRFLFSGYP